jgi:hypothetical protein
LFSRVLNVAKQRVLVADMLPCNELAVLHFSGAAAGAEEETKEQGK